MTLMTTEGDRGTARHGLTGFAAARFAIAFAERLARRRRQVATRRRLETLSPEQREDLGLEQVFRSVPIEEARLIATLMSMR